MNIITTGLMYAGRKKTIPVDSDAVAFITAAAITDTSLQNIVNKWVNRLKTAGMWTKGKAFYPMIGAAAAAHKYNAKDPRDLDAAYRITFNGGWTHNSSGAKPNGTTGYGDTHIVPSTAFSSKDNVCIQFYCTENAGAVASYEIGVADGTSRISMLIKWNDNTSYNTLCTSDRSVSSAITDTRGLFTGSRIISTSTDFYRNATFVANDVVNSIALPVTRSIYLGAGNENGTASNFSARNCAGAAFMDGLTASEISIMYNIWQEFQTSLGRNV